MEDCASFRIYDEESPEVKFKGFTSLAMLQREPSFGGVSKGIKQTTPLFFGGQADAK